ncbi:MAG: PIN domain-containing protein [Planctomycetes bacterium]|nr:PIN domain-containing protein [Planctomycetota bacterium]
MRFWDSSAVVALLLEEPATTSVRPLLAADREVIVWALTPLEVLSALWRRRRREELDEASGAAAEAGLEDLERVWSEVGDLDEVRRRTRRMLAVHPLRAADAAQLAAALLACDERSDLLTFVSLDGVLAEAARREGFAVLP